jgi:hypothetical protein
MIKEPRGARPRSLQILRYTFCYFTCASARDNARRSPNNRILKGVLMPRQSADSVDIVELNKGKAKVGDKKLR